MKKYIKYIAFNIYVVLHNIAISFYGLKVNRIRYAGKYREYYGTYQQNLSMRNDELIVYTERRLKKIIKDAGLYVPYYRRIFRRDSIIPEEFDSIDDLNRLPILEKESIRKNSSDFIDERLKRSSLLEIHTTGTTGTPLDVFCDKNTRQRNYAFYDRFLQCAAIDPKGKRATFGGRIIIPGWQNDPPFWRYSYFQKNMLFSSYHLSERNIPCYIEQLKKYKPDYIDSYPSSIFTVAEFARQNTIDLQGVTKAITTSAETLFPEQREVIETVFGVPVFDQYGAAEMCIFAAQCKEGSYHIHTDYGHVEFIREDGTAAEAGEEADIICTGYINTVMPLIRYRIGDRGVLSAGRCSCGSPFPVLEKLLGRIDDVIVTPDGKKIGRLSPVVKGFPVKEVQYVQRTRESVEVVLVVSDQYNSDTEIKLVHELRKRLGDRIKIQFTYTDKIIRGKGGKLKSIVSLLNAD